MGSLLPLPERGSTKRAREITNKAKRCECTEIENDARKRLELLVVRDELGCPEYIENGKNVGSI